MLFRSVVLCVCWLFPSHDKNEERRKRLKKALKRVKKASEKGDDPKYQAYMRVYKIFSPEKYGKEFKSLFAKDCIIGNWDGIPLPEVCPSILVRNQIKKVYLKFVNKYNLNIFSSVDTKKKLIKFKESDGSITDSIEDLGEEDE